MLFKHRNYMSIHISEIYNKLRFRIDVNYITNYNCLFYLQLTPAIILTTLISRLYWWAFHYTK